MQVTRYSDASQPFQSTWRDYLELAKPRLVAMQLLVTMTVMFIGHETMPALSTFLLTLVGGLFASAGASILNCYYDIDLDSNIKRTQSRPLPAQRIHPQTAYSLGVALSVLSIIVFMFGVNLLAAALAGLGIFLYVVVYTRWLKRRTPYNTLVGALANAIPPLVGWAAANGSLSMEALVLAGIVFYWTPPHYWSLAFVEHRENVRIGLPVAPVVHGSQSARIQIGRFSVFMVVLSLLPVGMGMANVVYSLVALTFGGWFVYQAIMLMKSPSSKLAWQLYKFSTLYLAFLFAGLLADRVIFF